MKESEYRMMCDFLLRRMGLLLTPDKAYLIKSRLAPLLRKHALKDIGSIVEACHRDESSALAFDVLDAMSTNETMFFRDQYPFTAMREVVWPALVKEHGKRPIHVWSAACATGQEAYSLAMLIREAGVKPEMLKLLATDLSQAALSYARAGIFTEMEVRRGLPEKHLSRYFSRQGRRYHIDPILKSMVKFAHCNLITDALARSMSAHGPFDVVFCRNVLIYFAPEERKKVIDRLAHCMRPHGYLFTGAAESPEGLTSRWRAHLFCGKRYWQLM
ncbi:MAG: protein-glutamate O-methyltransferase CheR [Mariprofundus sp.]|nr:protein-glutamate O-methyltransferase CheR [Mariprofundus sp.]